MIALARTNRTEADIVAQKRRKKAGKKRVIRSRDPFWRLRRALGGSRVESRKAYRRSASRAATRNQIDDS